MGAMRGMTGRWRRISHWRFENGDGFKESAEILKHRNDRENSETLKQKDWGSGARDLHLASRRHKADGWQLTAKLEEADAAAKRRKRRKKDIKYETNLSSFFLDNTGARLVGRQSWFHDTGRMQTAGLGDLARTSAADSLRAWERGTHREMLAELASGHQ